MQGEATGQQAGADQDEAVVKDGFRGAMRRLAGTVTIVTVKSGTERHGTTATAVTSVSMDPPSMLVCINRDSRLHGYLQKEDHFCVNMLHADNIEASRLFASPVSAEERFAGGDWRLDEDKAPWLGDAQANVFCRKERAIDYGSHTIFIGRVECVHLRDDISPLIYKDGAYGMCAGLLQPAPTGKPDKARKAKG